MNNSKNTISSSKEESIMKAFEQLQEDLKINNNKNKIKRPNINTKKIFFRLLILILLQILDIIFGIYFYNKFSSKWFIFICILILFIINIITLKKSLIELILLYQKYAPDEMRKSCLFEPSCSEYMILSINKYGVIKGTFKGIKRILRCHYPNGGIDYP